MTHFSAWPRWAAQLVLVVMIALAVYAAIPKTAVQIVHMGPPGYDDRYFQRSVADLVTKGQNYYAAAADQQRAHFYPTYPAETFREPTLTWLLALLGTQTARRAALLALLAGATVAMREALDTTTIPKLWRLPATLFQITGFAISWHSLQAYQHEVWAALLMALSLGLYRPYRYWPSVIIAVLACLIRELALPFIWAMGAFAIYERRWPEVKAWAIGMTVFLILFAFHLHVAAGFHRPTDLVSAGWLYGGGWDFVIETSRKNFVLYYSPAWVVSLAVCLGVIGLAGWRDPLVSRAALIVGGYVAAFLVVGRPDNAYWGMMYSPLLPLGWVLAPAALLDLIKRAGARNNAVGVTREAT